jgi:hypothetical protein
MSVRHVAPALALGLVGATSAAFAQEFSGAEIDLGYTAYVNDASLEKISLRGAGEYALTDRFSVQGNLLFSRFGGADISGQNVTVHGLYHFDGPHSVGLFFGRDVIDDIRTNLAGIEGRHTVRGWDFEWYVGDLLEGNTDALIFGLDTWYEVYPALYLGAHYDRANFNVADTEFSTFTLSASYQISERSTIYAEYGSNILTVNSVSAGEDIFSFGVRFGFGPNGGTTMGYRSLDAILPGR